MGNHTGKSYRMSSAPRLPGACLLCVDSDKAERALAQPKTESGVGCQAASARGLARRTQTPILVQTGRGAGTCALRACAMSVVAEGEGLEKHHAVLLATVRRRERSGSRATAMKRTSRPRPADSRNDRTPFVKYQVFQSWLLWRHRSTPAGAGSAGTTRGRSAATVVRFVLCFFRCPC